MSVPVIKKTEPKFKNERFYTLSAVAWSCCRDLKAGEERFEEMLHHCFEGWRELTFDIAHSVKSVEIEMKPWKQIDWPCDMVDWTKVGFKCGDFLKILVNDTHIPKTHDKINCVPQENLPCPDINSTGITDMAYPFYGGIMADEGNITPQFYGWAVPHNFLGYFDVDITNRVINFKETASNHTKVYLEYITDGINPDEETVIHPYIYRLLKLFVHWNRKLNDDRYTEGERREAERRYNNQFDVVLIRQLDLSIEDIKDALRHGYKQTPKQ
jgi:hypothetical protein